MSRTDAEWLCFTSRRGHVDAVDTSLRVTPHRYYDFSPKWKCELPESVYLLFHRDRNTDQHRFGCCSRDWLAKQPSGRVPCGGMVAKGRRPPPPPKKPPVPPPPVSGVAKSVV